MYVLYNKTYQIECWKHSHPARLPSSAGNTVIPQDFEQWTTKERQDFISSISTWTLCNYQVDWVNVGVDPKHLDDREGDEYSPSLPYVMTHKSPGLTLRNFKNSRFIYSLKLTKG
jgi:hypothetical protein